MDSIGTTRRVLQTQSTLTRAKIIDTVRWELWECENGSAVIRLLDECSGFCVGMVSYPTKDRASAVYEHGRALDDPPKSPEPGAWRIGNAGTAVFGPKKSDGSLPEIIADRMTRSNARLLAAAPAMLAALRDIVISAKRWGNGLVDTSRAAEAIARAERGAS